MANRAIFDHLKEVVKLHPGHDFGYKFVLASVHPEAVKHCVSHCLGLRFTYF